MIRNSQDCTSRNAGFGNKFIMLHLKRFSSKIQTDKYWSYLVVLAAILVALGFMLFLSVGFEDGLAKHIGGGRTFATSNANPLIAFLYSLQPIRWIGIQIIGLIAIALGIGALSYAISEQYRLLPALLATVTPSIFFWVPSATGEIPLLAASTWGMFFLVKYIKSNHWLHAIIAGVLFSIALLSRGTLVIFPFAGLSVLVVARVFSSGWSILPSLKFWCVPFAAPLLVVLGMSAGNYFSTGYWFWSSQGGQHLLEFVYPCLKKPYGCGERDPDLKRDIKRETASEMMARELTFEKKDIGSVNELRKSIAWEKLRGEKKGALVVAAMFAYAKILVYTPVRNMLGRQGIVQGGIFNDHSHPDSDEELIRWRNIGISLIESINLIYLFVAGVGLWLLVVRKDTREVGLLFGVYIVSVVGTGLGIGNPRYAAGTFVAMIPLLFLGIGYLHTRLGSTRKQRAQDVDR